jgi:hypothetical protein
MPLLRLFWLSTPKITGENRNLDYKSVKTSTNFETDASKVNMNSYAYEPSNRLNDNSEIQNSKSSASFQQLDKPAYEGTEQCKNALAIT